MTRRPLTLAFPPPGARGPRTIFVVAILLAWFVSSGSPARAADPAPAGQMIFAVHFTLAPRWLDPAESEGSITPFLALYAVHDALLKMHDRTAFAPSGRTASSAAWDRGWKSPPSR
jgi:hypothetical protein